MKRAGDYTAELRRAHLFAHLSDEHLNALAHDVREVRLAAGQSLFRRGQAAEHFFFVRAGTIKLFRLSPEGDEKIIEVMRPGDTFAEAVMFMGMHGRYPVDAEAVSEARLLAFGQKRFLSLLRASPEVCFGLLASMSRRLHMLVNQIESLTLQNATYRVVAYILEQLPDGVAAAPEIELTTPKSVIAARLGIQPETLSRTLARLRRAGLVDVDGNHVTLRDIDALRRLVDLPPETAPE